MKIELSEKPKNPIIIEGVPGFGLASTIATDFLIKHLGAKRIGRIYSNKIKPIVAIHNSEIINPLEIFYDKQHNIVILRTLTTITGAEWEIAEIIMGLAKKFRSKEVISLEGIASEKGKKNNIYYYTNLQRDRFKLLDLENMKDGIVLGVTGVLLLKERDLPLSCIFVEANPNLPDSRAAGEIIKVLDSYLGLKVDYKPLIKTAEEFEGKLKGLLEKIKQGSNQKGKNDVSYLG